MTKELVQQLKTGNVDITFESLTSGREITNTYTLKTLFKLNINNKSEKILAYDVERREWEDIEVSSIKKWKKQENGVL